MAEPTLPPARHERRDVEFHHLLIGFAGTLAVVLACTLLVIAIYPSAVVDRWLPQPPAAYPEPRLQSSPQADLQRFLAAERARLDSAGSDHIPIEEAMQRIAHHGIPDWPTPARQSP